MMNVILEYLRQDYAQVTVVAPWAFTIFWYFWEGRKHPPPLDVCWWWTASLWISWWMSSWEVTDSARSLHIVNAFIMFVIFNLYAQRDVITPAVGYVFSFTLEWAVDMTRAYELVLINEASPSTYFLGVGGAGLHDGLLLFPFCTAVFIYYARWRLKAPLVNLQVNVSSWYR
jgi:hypothetical protein